MADLKEMLASYSIKLLTDKKTIGIGTGKTVRMLIEKIYQNKDIFKDRLFITSSIDSELRLKNYGFNVISIYTGVEPEIYIDSFDHLININDLVHLVMIKGGGGALFREKVLATYSKLRIYLGEESKILYKKSMIKIPLEVLPFASNYVIGALKKDGLSAEIRESEGKIGAVFSDNGNMILDVRTASDNDLCSLNLKLRKVTGVLETGIFCSDLVDKIIIAGKEDEIRVVTK